MTLAEARAAHEAARQTAAAAALALCVAQGASRAAFIAEEGAARQLFQATVEDLAFRPPWPAIRVILLNRGRESEAIAIEEIVSDSIFVGRRLRGESLVWGGLQRFSTALGERRADLIKWIAAAREGGPPIRI